MRKVSYLVLTALRCIGSSNTTQFRATTALAASMVATTAQRWGPDLQKYMLMRRDYVFGIGNLVYCRIARGCRGLHVLCHEAPLLGDSRPGGRTEFAFLTRGP